MKQRTNYAYIFAKYLRMYRSLVQFGKFVGIPIEGRPMCRHGTEKIPSYKSKTKKNLWNREILHLHTTVGGADMSELDSQMYKEIVDLIPRIVDAGQTCLQRELDANIHDPAHMESERQRFQEAIDIIQGRWTIDVLYVITLFEAPSYNQILQALPGINSRTLTDRLKHLEGKEVIERTIQAIRPVRVNYRVTEYGKKLISLLLPAVLFCGWPELIKG
jgi:DNA-binding HxlR family transcriptional regulator